MLVGKIQTNLIQKKICNTKNVTSSKVAQTITELPKGIDSKAYTNITFRGRNELLLTSVGSGRAIYDTLMLALDGGADVNTLGRDNITPLIAVVGCNRDENKYKCIEELLSREDIDVNRQTERNKTTALMRACCFYDAKAVELLLNHPDIDVNIQDAAGRTALFDALKNINTEILELLLKHPDIDVNKKDTNGISPLYEACSANRPNHVKLLLSHPDIDVNASNSEEGFTALMYSIYYGCIDNIKELIKHPNLDMSIKWRGKTALEHAKDCLSPRGYKMIADYIPGVDKREVLPLRPIPKKEPVNIDKLSSEENIWSEGEITAKFLQLVQDKKYEDAIKMLDSSPLIDLDEKKNQVMAQVCSTGKPDFVRKVFDYERNQEQMLSEYEKKRKEFFERTIKIASYEELKNNNIVLNTIEGLRILMAHPEFNPNEAIDGITLFEKACELDPEGEVAKEILSKYEDVITNKNTNNAVIKDLVKEYEETGKFRLKLRHIIENAMNEETRTKAAEQLMTLLQSNNFNPKLADECGNGILHIAAALPDDSSRAIIQKALDKGVNMNAGNITGQTPLMAAIKSVIKTRDEAGKRNVMANIKFLLDKGVDINAQDNNGQTAFHFVCLSTVAALLTLMLSKKPNVFLEDKMGNRAAKYLKTPEMKEIYNNYLGMA